jgi:hypothetical protein
MSSVLIGNDFIFGFLASLVLANLGALVQTTTLGLCHGTCLIEALGSELRGGTVEPQEGCLVMDSRFYLESP